MVKMTPMGCRLSIHDFETVLFLLALYTPRSRVVFAGLRSKKFSNGLSLTNVRRSWTSLCYRVVGGLFLLHTVPFSASSSSNPSLCDTDQGGLFIGKCHPCMSYLRELRKVGHFHLSRASGRASRIKKQDRGLG